jgi:uncharacterized membrane protein YphA (DoxX/SURF4 family)
MTGMRQAAIASGGSSRWATAGPWLATAARVALAAVWIAAGVLKIPDPAASVRAVRAYRILPESVMAPVAYGLPFLEIALGGLLLLGIAVRLAALISATLLILFLAAITSAWLRGLQIDCGCFGGGEVAPGHTQYGWEIARDLALLAAALALVRWPRSRLAVDTVTEPKAVT